MYPLDLVAIAVEITFMSLYAQGVVCSQIEWIAILISWDGNGKNPAKPVSLKTSDNTYHPGYTIITMQMQL